MLQTEGHKQYNLQDAHKHEYEVSDANEDDIKMKLILTSPPKEVAIRRNVAPLKQLYRQMEIFWMCDSHN